MLCLAPHFAAGVLGPVIAASSYISPCVCSPVPVRGRNYPVASCQALPVFVSNSFPLRGSFVVCFVLF